MNVNYLYKQSTKYLLVLHYLDDDETLQMLPAKTATSLGLFVEDDWQETSLGSALVDDMVLLSKEKSEVFV